MEKTVVASLKLRIGEYLANLTKARVATGQFMHEVAGAGAATDRQIRSVSRGALVMAGGIAAGLAVATKAAIDWESAWAGVNKTVDGTTGQMAELEDDLRGLARELPASHREIAAVAEAAGQLGIKREAIAGFTRTMVDLGETTNLTADEAATSIAQMANIMGTSQGDVDRLGAALVELGNNGASTEREILDMSLRLAGAGKLIGASEADVLALANAMASLGIQSELGGGAMSRTLYKIYAAVKDGGDKLEGFAEIAGASAQEFAAKFGAQPLQAVDDFVHGLGRIDAEGGNVIAALREVGIKGTQDLQVISRLTGAGNLLTDSLKMGSRAWLDNVALQEEAAKRYDTTASRLRVLRNQAVDVAIDVGGTFIPAIKAATGVTGDMITGFAELDGAGRGVVVGLGSAAGAVTGIVGIVGFAGPKIRDFRDSLMSMGSGGQFFGRNLGMISGVLGAVTLGLGLYTYELGKNARKQQEAARRAEELATAIEEQGTKVGDQTNELILTSIVAGKVGQELRDAGTDLTVFLTAINGAGEDSDELADALVRIRDEAEHIDLGQTSLDQFRAELEGSALAGTQLGDTLLELAASGDISGDALGQLIGRLAEQITAYDDAKVASDNKAAADEAVETAARGAAAGTQAQKRAADQLAGALEKAEEALRDLIDAERAQFDPLFGMLDALEGNKDAAAALAEAHKAAAEHPGKVAEAERKLAEAQQKLNEKVNAGTASAEDLADAQAKVESAQEDLNDVLEDSGLEDLDQLQRDSAKSALDVTAAAMALAGQIRLQPSLLTLAKASLSDWVAQGLISQETAEEMGRQFDIAAGKADALAADRVGSIAIEVDTARAEDGMERFFRKFNLGAFGGPLVLTLPQINDDGSLSAFDITNPSRWGNVFSYGKGGITPAHIAQPGTLLKYAEPETGGEAFIPRLGNMARSIGILRTVAGWFGLGVAPKDMLSFAGGGVWNAPGTVYEDGSVRGGSPIPGSTAWWEDHPDWTGPSPTDWDAYEGTGASEWTRQQMEAEWARRGMNGRSTAASVGSASRFAGPGTAPGQFSGSSGGGPATVVNNYYTTNHYDFGDIKADSFDDIVYKADQRKQLAALGGMAD